MSTIIAANPGFARIYVIVGHRAAVAADALVHEYPIVAWNIVEGEDEGKQIIVAEDIAVFKVELVDEADELVAGTVYPDGRVRSDQGYVYNNRTEFVKWSYDWIMEGRRKQ